MDDTSSIKRRNGAKRMNSPHQRTGPYDAESPSFPMLQATLETMTMSVGRLERTELAQQSSAPDRVRQLLGPNPADPVLAKRLVEDLNAQGVPVEDVLRILDEPTRKGTGRVDSPRSPEPPPPKLTPRRAGAMQAASNASPLTSQGDFSSSVPARAAVDAGVLEEIGNRTLWWAAKAGLSKSKRCELAELLLACLRPHTADPRLRIFCDELFQDLNNLRAEIAKTGASEYAVDSTVPGEDLQIIRLTTELERFKSLYAELVLRNKELVEENVEAKSIAGKLAKEAANGCKILHITAFAVPKPVTGTYDLVPSASANGFPLWKQRTGNHWLYTGYQFGQWLVGDDVERDALFRCDSGIVSSTKSHRGLLPQCFTSGQWRRLAESDWLVDPTITITRVDEDTTKARYATIEKLHAEVLAEKDRELDEKDLKIQELNRLLSNQGNNSKLPTQGGASKISARVPAQAKSQSGQTSPTQVSTQGGSSNAFVGKTAPSGTTPEVHVGVVEISVEASEDDTELGCKLTGKPPKPVSIKSLTNDGWAKSVKLRVGDTLVAVDGKAIGELSTDELKKAWTETRPLVLVFQRQGEDVGDNDVGVGRAQEPKQPALNPTGGQNEAAKKQRYAKLIELTAGTSVKKIGFRTKGTPPNPVVITQILPESWCSTEDVNPGDEIVKLQNLPVREMTEQEMNKLIASKPLTMTIGRPAVG